MMLVKAQQPHDYIIIPGPTGIIYHIKHCLESQSQYNSVRLGWESHQLITSLVIMVEISQQDVMQQPRSVEVV